MNPQKGVVGPTYNMYLSSAVFQLQLHEVNQAQLHNPVYFITTSSYKITFCSERCLNS